jgi:hypothetical protein
VTHRLPGNRLEAYATLFSSPECRAIRRNRPDGEQCALSLVRFFHGAAPGTGGGGEYRVQEPREKVVQLLAAERIGADDSVRFHPDDPGFAEHFEMAGSRGLAQIEWNFTTVQPVRVGDGTDDLKPGRIAQSKEDRGKADLILSRMKRLSHLDT